ncbi:hypothetical protein EJ05DRAFT_67466 [Pseudovirgaria hyperparasitica]|uniref:Uncharacterized protein n=1 Tax=Pseudovirgaria hyperparasitica TaxID=470096 RepID=A0A6A6W660_9PEZI|nr:uncharacterized protein EJ05DRAFT_67466 [Pseudovirgaria hyperparasitica]KAF2756551.1 hypothetical protein EJ05DRAFT_67466 [Pseudovirgaria hyperparasitica]
MHLYKKVRHDCVYTLFLILILLILLNLCIFHRSRPRLWACYGSDGILRSDEMEWT